MGPAAPPVTRSPTALILMPPPRQLAAVRREAGERAPGPGSSVRGLRPPLLHTRRERSGAGGAATPRPVPRSGERARPEERATAAGPAPPGGGGKGGRSPAGPGRRRRSPETGRASASAAASFSAPHQVETRRREATAARGRAVRYLRGRAGCPPPSAAAAAASHRDAEEKGLFLPPPRRKRSLRAPHCSGRPPRAERRGSLILPVRLPASPLRGLDGRHAASIAGFFTQFPLLPAPRGRGAPTLGSFGPSPTGKSPSPLLDR